MKFMRADRLDAIVAAAIYSAMFTFGVTYAVNANSESMNSWMLKAAEEQFLSMRTAFIECKHEKIGHRDIAPGGQLPTASDKKR